MAGKQGSGEAGQSNSMKEQVASRRGGYSYPDLAGKIVLVTGSSRGIGAAIARRFAEAGSKVVLHGRDSAALSGVQHEIVSSGGTAMQVTGDVTRFEQIEIMRSQIEGELGPIDILVANAGGSYTRPGPFEEIDEQGWRASVEGNLTATFLTIKSVLPGMKRRKAGNIITISSAAARRPHPQSPVPYAAAKAGIQMLTQHLAAQVGPLGIRVNCVAPETILTERNQQQIPDPQKKALVETHPIRRLGTPDDVARAVLYLSSEQSSWVTGVILDVSGGAVMV
jgi:3-oxoacyl-[acyl-carrier protein] reductase